MNTEEFKAHLLANFALVGVADDKASEIVDLSMHATQKAIDALLTVSKASSDATISVSVIHLGSQLIAQRAKALFAETSKGMKDRGIAKEHRCVDVA